MPTRTQRAEAVQRVLAARNLTRHSAHVRLEISRPAIDKMWLGQDVQVETVERFARGLGLDVNEWRQLWDYEPVEAEAPADEPGLEQVRLFAHDGGDFSDHDLGLFREFLAWQRERDRLRQRG